MWKAQRAYFEKITAACRSIEPEVDKDGATTSTSEPGLREIPFLKLDIDVQIMVMERCEPASLYNLVQTCNHTLRLYHRKSGSILKGALQRWPLQIQRLIFTALELHRVPEFSIAPDELEAYLSGSLNSTDPIREMPMDDNKRSAIRLLRTLASEIDLMNELILRSTFALDYFSELVRNMPLSVAESNRMTRAFWRLHILILLESRVSGVLYCRRCPRCQSDMKINYRVCHCPVAPRYKEHGSWAIFLQLLDPWEKEEMISIRSFITRVMEYLPPDSLPKYSILHRKFTAPENELPARRNPSTWPSTFDQTLEMHTALNWGYYECFHPFSHSPHPVPTEQLIDPPDTNGRAPGWAMYRSMIWELRSRYFAPPGRDGHTPIKVVTLFQNLGYIMWDRQRLMEAFPPQSIDMHLVGGQSDLQDCIKPPSHTLCGLGMYRVIRSSNVPWWLLNELGRLWCRNGQHGKWCQQWVLSHYEEPCLISSIAAKISDGRAWILGNR